MNKKNTKRTFSQAKPKSSSAFSLPEKPLVSLGTVELEIEKLTFSGDGLSRKDGLVYFVPFTAAGDVISAQIFEKKKNFARAEVLEVLRPSATRTKPLCPVYGKCGGCNWQHLSYEEQLSQKQNILQEQLAGVVDKSLIGPLIPSPKPFRYRNRIQLKFDGKSLGFFARQSHQVINIEDCPITEEALTQTLPALKDKLLTDGKAIPKIEVFRTPENQVITKFEDSPFEGVGFSQVNSDQNEKLIETVLSWWKPEDPRKIYDLYSGSGNFTFPLLRQFPKSSFVGVDMSSASIAAGQNLVNAQNLSPLKMKFYLADVELYLKRQVLDENALVLIDPPRAGCTPGVVQALAQQKLKSILYISCNPSALARDLKAFVASGKWKIGRIQAFDMFPQTDHVETLVELLPLAI